MRVKPWIVSMRYELMYGRERGSLKCVWFDFEDRIYNVDKFGLNFLVRFIIISTHQHVFVS
jgi:hypothetical protein